MLSSNESQKESDPITEIVFHFNTQLDNGKKSLRLACRRKRTLCIPSVDKQNDFLHAIASAFKLVALDPVAIGFNNQKLTSIFDLPELIPLPEPHRGPSGTFWGLHFKEAGDTDHEYPPLINGGPTQESDPNNEYTSGDIRWILIEEVVSQSKVYTRQVLVDADANTRVIVNVPAGPLREQFRRTLASAFRIGSSRPVSIMFDDEPDEPLILYTEREYPKTSGEYASWADFEAN